jgi:hypothetical protein
MKQDADKVRCHPRKRGGSEHQLRERSSLADSVRSRCWVLPLVNIEQTLHTVPRSPKGMPTTACRRSKARQGRARLCAYETKCLLCGENFMRRPRANVTKRAERLLRRREIGVLQPLLPIWSASTTNLSDRQRVGRCARDQVCGFQER